MTSIRELHVVLSDYCNIKCNYCSVYKRKDVSQYIIDKEAFKLANSVRDKALLENVHFDIITLIGGEPTTISPTVLAECVNILQDVCNIVSIQTNGVAFGRHQYFNSFTKNIKNKYKLNISISCDGPQSIHDLNRDNSYKYVEKAIDNSIKYIGEIGLVCVVGKHTIENKAMFELWIETILKNKAIHPQIRVEMGTNRMTDSDQVKLGKIIVNNGLYPYSEVGRKTTVNKGNNCDTLVVSTNTIVRGCLKFTNTEVKLDMTSINENTFDEIVEKRKKLFSTVLISEDCKTCKYKDICNSGCPLFRKTTGKANECFLRKTVYKEDCNLYGEESGCFKKVGKSLKKVGKKATKSLKKAGKKLGKGISGLLPIETVVSKWFGSAVGAIGGAIGGSLGRELQRWENDIEQVGKVLSGEYHKDAKKVEAYQKKVREYGEQYGDRVKDYNNKVDMLADKMDSLIAFHEIFQMALGNRLDVLHAEYSPELALMDEQYSAMVAELKRMVARLESEYDFVIGLTEGAFVQRIIGSVIMIIGGLMNDLSDILSGKADSSTWGRIGMVIVLVILIIIAIFFPPAWGLVATVGGTMVMTVTYMVVVGLMILSAFMTLDGMYSNGAATGAIMGLLDGIFNDILNLDDLIGSDFEKFDKDHEDYSQMVGYVQLAIALTSAYLAWSSSSAYYAGLEASKTAGINSAPLMSMAPTSGVGGNALATASGQLTQQTIGSATTSGVGSTTQYLGGAVEIGSSAADSKLFGVTFSTYSDIYEAFSAAMKVKDYISANKHYEDMKNKFEQDKEKLTIAIESKINKNMMKHYKDTAYFLQDQQEQIDNYIWSMTAENMYVDPYGTTPIANIRFTPDKDTRGLGFGFEDMFDESMLAGSRGYFNNIIYGS